MNCLDTSGSMRGAPETVAMAVGMQAVRTAHAEGRGCLLIAFGGGTDLQGLIARAIARVHEARWAGADLLIVSDGEFGHTADTLDRLDAARAQSACGCRACWSATARPSA